MDWQTITAEEAQIEGKVEQLFKMTKLLDRKIALLRREQLAERQKKKSLPGIMQGYSVAGYIPTHAVKK